MIKKALVATLVAGVAATFLFGRDVLSYVKTCGSEMRTAVKSEVPLEFEIQRARDLVENLVPDIRDCMQTIAEQQVEIDHLTGEITRKEAGLEDQEAAILALRSDLTSGKDTFVYASRTYTTGDIKRDLEKRFERFKVARKALERDRQILDARRTAVEANQEQLNNMLAKRQELEVQIAQLEARLETIQAAETVSSLAIDDSRLNQARGLIDDLNRQLDIREKVLDSEGRFTGLIPVEVESGSDSDVAEEIDEYFGRSQDAEAETLEVEPSA